MNIDQDLCAPNTVDTSQRFFGVVFNCRRNIRIVRRQGDLYFDLAILDLDRFTSPNETISRVKPGYFTDFKAFFTCSSEIDMSEPYVRRARGKPRGIGWIVLSSRRWQTGEASFPPRCACGTIPGGMAAVANALRTTRSTYELSVLVIHFVADLILVSARGARRLLAPFRYKVRVLPVRPGAVFRLIGLAGSLSRKIRSVSPGNFNTKRRCEVRK
jgi:hypothetical protein